MASSSENFEERQIDLYVLADKLEDDKTANKIIDRIYKHSDAISGLPIENTLSHACSSTETDSPLRALLRDMMIYEGTNDSWIDGDTYSLPKEFIKDVMIKFMKIKRTCEISGTTFDEVFGPEVMKMRMLNCCYDKYEHGDKETPKCTQSRSIQVDDLPAVDSDSES